MYVAAAESVYKVVHAPSKVWPLLRPHPPTPSCLVGSSGVDVVEVVVACMVELGLDVVDDFVASPKERGVHHAGVEKLEGE